MTAVAKGQDRTPDSDSDALAGLLAAAAAGQEWAWRAIVDRFGKRVFALAKSRCRRADLAEEITQSVFASVAAKVGQGLYTEKGRFESWLFRVTMNRVRDEVRRAKRHGTCEQGDGLAIVEDPRSGRDRGETVPGEGLAKLRGAMDLLAESDRDVIELRHHGGLSFRQMADLLDEPVGTLLARHHRALRKLREAMEQQGGTDAVWRGGEA